MKRKLCSWIQRRTESIGRYSLAIKTNKNSAYFLQKWLVATKFFVFKRDFACLLYQQPDDLGNEMYCSHKSLAHTWFAEKPSSAPTEQFTELNVDSYGETYW